MTKLFRPAWLVLPLLWCALFLLLNDGWTPDMGAIYFAAHHFGTGLLDQVYAAPEPFFGATIKSDEALALLADTGHEKLPVLPYVYPPLTAILLSPLATRHRSITNRILQHRFGAELSNANGVRYSCMAACCGAGGLTYWLGVDHRGAFDFQLAAHCPNPSQSTAYICDFPHPVVF